MTQRRTKGGNARISRRVFAVATAIVAASALAPQYPLSPESTSLVAESVLFPALLGVAGWGMWAFLLNRREAGLYADIDFASFWVIPGVGWLALVSHQLLGDSLIGAVMFWLATFCSLIGAAMVAFLVARLVRALPDTPRSDRPSLASVTAMSFGPAGVWVALGAAGLLALVLGGSENGFDEAISASLRAVPILASALICMASVRAVRHPRRGWERVARGFAVGWGSYMILSAWSLWAEARIVELAATTCVALCLAGCFRLGGAVMGEPATA